MALAIDDRKGNGALWNSIDWEKARRIVNRLQTRIVKAVKAEDKQKVRSLQRLLARSFSGKLIAVKRVSENRGKRTAGVDGKLIDTPAKKRSKEPAAGRLTALYQCLTPVR